MVRPADPARQAALSRGEKRYLSALPCPHGHVGERFTVSTGCYTCAKLYQKMRHGDTKKPKPEKKPKCRVSVKVRAESIAVAKTRFNRPKFVHALADCRNSVEAAHHNAILDSLIRKVPR
jgi:hypothetical protein